MPKVRGTIALSNYAWLRHGLCMLCTGTGLTACGTRHKLCHKAGVSAVQLQGQCCHPLSGSFPGSWRAPYQAHISSILLDPQQLHVIMHSVECQGFLRTRTGTLVASKSVLVLSFQVFLYDCIARTCCTAAVRGFPDFCLSLPASLGCVCGCCAAHCHVICLGKCLMLSL